MTHLFPANPSLSRRAWRLAANVSKAVAIPSLNDEMSFSALSLADWRTINDFIVSRVSANSSGKFKSFVSLIEGPLSSDVVRNLLGLFLKIVDGTDDGAGGSSLLSKSTSRVSTAA